MGYGVSNDTSPCCWKATISHYCKAGDTWALKSLPGRWGFACGTMAASCTNSMWSALVLHAGGRLFPHDDVSNCWFVAQDAEAAAKWSDYLFMTSIQFLVQREMVEIAPRSAVRGTRQRAVCQSTTA